MMSAGLLDVASGPPGCCQPTLCVVSEPLSAGALGCRQWGPVDVSRRPPPTTTHTHPRPARLLSRFPRIVHISCFVLLVFVGRHRFTDLALRLLSILFGAMRGQREAIVFCFWSVVLKFSGGSEPFLVSQNASLTFCASTLAAIATGPRRSYRSNCKGRGMHRRGEGFPRPRWGHPFDERSPLSCSAPKVGDDVGEVAGQEGQEFQGKHHKVHERLHNRM